MDPALQLCNALWPVMFTTGCSAMPEHPQCDNQPCCRGSGPGAAEEAQTIKFELPPVPESVSHGEAAAKGFHFPTSEGFMFEAAAGVLPCLMLH